MKRKCDQCLEVYVARRASSKFCSPACRSAANRRKVRSPPLADAERQPIPALGVDPSTVDVRWILAGIAADPAQPGSVRVQACRALLVADAEQKKPTDRDDFTNIRAVEMLAAGRRLN